MKRPTKQTNGVHRAKTLNADTSGGFRTGTTTKQGASLSAQDAATGRKRMGLSRGRSTTPQPARAFAARFKLASMTPAERHKQVRKTLGPNFQKSVYGDQYKFGTVRKENKRIRSARDTKESIHTKAARLESELARSIDPSRSKALKSRIKKLDANREKVDRVLSTTKKDRQKYLDLRDKALVSVYSRTARRPGGVRRYAKGVAKRKLKKQTA